MYVDYWAVGSKQRSSMAMTAADVSKHLAADWVPSIATNVSSSFVGWPPYLLQHAAKAGDQRLCLDSVTGRTERQWKGMLSWMLGVAGTRQFLERDRYRWVAPMSAFYPNVKKKVAIPKWHTKFPPGILKADREPQSTSRLRPDYIAIRSTNRKGKLDWSVVESKGTDHSLSRMHNCPSAWRNQARNIQLTTFGSIINVSRHLVVATRVNPNAQGDCARRLQVRAWNSAREAETGLPAEAVLDVVSAHLFGFFRAVGLPENAAAIAQSVAARDMRENGEGAEALFDKDDQRSRADVELRQLTGTPTPSFDTPVRRTLEVPDAGLDFEISGALIAFSRQLRNSADPKVSFAALQRFDQHLDVSEGDEHSTEESASLPFGVRIHVKRRFRE